MNKKHLTLQKRQSIEQMLNSKMKLAEVAGTLGVSKSTISREVRAHAKRYRVGGQGFNFNECKKRYGCQKAWVCGTCKSHKKFKLCRRCAMCNSHCPDFEKEECPKLAKPPYVCNGCGKRSICTLEKKLYVANEAHEEYRNILSESRAGLPYTEEELQQLDQLITPLIQQGQSPYHICATKRRFNHDLRKNGLSSD